MKTSIQETLACDVLIIGKGGAGLMAALKASEYKVKIILVSKGESSTKYISAFNIPLGHEDPGDNPELFLKDTLREGGNLNDPNLVRILAEDSIKVFADLVELGVPFEKQNGKFRQRLTSGNTYPRSTYYKDVLGEEILKCLLGKIKEKDNIKILDDVVITDLILDESCVMGALGVDLKNDAFLAIRSKVTIIASGGAGNLYSFTTNPCDATGDGYVLAYSCGAKLVDMEFVQFEPTIIAFPESIRGSVMPTALLGKGAFLLNSKGERFMLKYDKEKKELTSKSILTRVIFSEISSGHGGPHNGVFFDASHLPKQVIEKGFSSLFKHLISAGIDLRKEPVEVAPASHYLMGGVKINERCQTTVSCLYAAGEVTGGIHGANRISGSSATDIFVFGSRAGNFAAIEAQSIKFTVSIHKFIKMCQKKINVNYEEEGDTLSESIRANLQKIMWDCVGIIRNKKGLTLALKKISGLQKKIKGIRVNNACEFKKDFETKNLLKLAEIVVKAAISRRKSIGAHYRSDFP